MKVKSKKAMVGDWIFVFICVIISLICVIPMINLLARSLSSTDALVRHEVYLLPKGLNFGAYSTVLSDMIIRKDWLTALNLEEPTTKEEFYNVLCQFRDNADTLLGADADKMVPYSVSYDVGWRTATLIESFMDPDITEKEYYVNGFDDRKLTENGTKIDERKTAWENTYGDAENLPEK